MGKAEHENLGRQANQAEFSCYYSAAKIKLKKYNG